MRRRYDANRSYETGETMTDDSIPAVFDGFWLPGNIPKSRFAGINFTTQTLCQGRSAQPGAPGAVTVRWPNLDVGEFQALLSALDENKRRVPNGATFWPRFQAALQQAARRLGNPADPLHRQALAALPGYTGYSPQMIAMALQAMAWFSLERLPQALGRPPSADAGRAWQALSGLPGWIRFFPQAERPGLAGLYRCRAKNGLYAEAERVARVVGYGAGNVPGAALLIGLLAQSAPLGGAAPPAILLRNSRREPVFTPLVLQAMEDADPDLVGATAVMVWNYEDRRIQAAALNWADTVIAAASDDTLRQIQEALRSAGSSQPARFQPHGHKVSFALIGQEMAAQGEAQLEQAARLAALDSAFWDQNGCLSARVHFIEQRPAVEEGDGRTYAALLAAALRRLAIALPRGAWPRRELHERFDYYKSLEAASLAQVFSEYDDDFLVFIDHRPWDGAAVRRAINECQGRVIGVRPVQDRTQIPGEYLRCLPPDNLQSLSVAVGFPGQAAGADFLRFAEACGQRGVTAIRSLGRGAFPQLAYSWDGFIPYDLIARRGAGRFCTIEFETPYEEMAATYQMMAPLFASAL